MPWKYTRMVPTIKRAALTNVCLQQSLGCLLHHPFPSLSLQQVQMCELGGLWLCPAGSLKPGNLEAGIGILGVTSYFILDAALETREKVLPWLPLALTLACQLEIRVVVQQLFILWTLWFGKGKETLELSRNMLSCSFFQEESKADVLLSAGMELIFFNILVLGLCFGFVSWG